MDLNTAYEKVNMHLYYQGLLEECYNKRVYHNMEHVKEMLKYVPDDHPELEILIEAILFHDIIQLPYPCPSGLNESLSACEYVNYTTKYLEYDVPFASKGNPNMEYERRVIEAITATGRHLEDQKFLNKTSQLVLDFDLSTFALPRDEYLVWKEKILKENEELYKDFFTSEQITQGRYDFLSKLLERKQLYYVKTEWEELARKNITYDLIEIERDLGGEEYDR